jgi:glycosyltransferase involved in cell wall biosynthesis
MCGGRDHVVRIAHFSEAAVDGVNGIAASVRLLTGELAWLGHDNLVVSAGPLWGRRRRDGVLWMRSAPTGMGDFRWVLLPRHGMRERVRRWRPDVAHVHTPGPLGAAALAVAEELGIPAVYTYHTDMHGYASHYSIPTPVIRAGTVFYGRHLRRGAPTGESRSGKYDAVEAANARIFEAAQVIIVPTATALRRCTTAPAYADRVRVVATPPVRHPAATLDFRDRYGIARDAVVVLFVGTRRSVMRIILSRASSAGARASSTGDSEHRRTWVQCGASPLTLGDDR